MLVTALVFILVLGILIFVHEFGHFIVAKLAGIQVEEFAFGFPPRLYSKKWKGTRYGINLIPIGGYVRLLGEEEHLASSKSFSRKSVWTRLAVVVAGVVMNYLLAVVVFAAGFMIGMTPYFTDPATLGGIQQPLIYIGQVLPGSPAEQAGIKVGERLKGFASDEEVQQFTRTQAGQTVSLELEDEKGGSRSVSVALRSGDQAPLGVALYETAVVKLPIHRALVAGGREASSGAEFTVRFFGSAVANFFTRGQVPQEIGGPVAIFGVTALAVSQGIVALLRIIGILSVNLAVLNSVPFPALDGGKALFLAAEALFGRRVLRHQHEAIIHTIGFALLIALIVAVTYRDIIRL